MAQPIEDHGIIGDLRTAALVTLDGTVDFLCWPRFDSPSIFASLLDDERGGHFRLSPTLDRARQCQLYLPDTNVLLTRFLSHEGVAEVSDLMAMDEPGPFRDSHAPQRLIRRAKAVRGPTRFCMVCAPRFDYGRATTTAAIEDGHAIFRAEGVHFALRLRCSVQLQLHTDGVIAEFDLEAGETAAFILEDASHPVPETEAEDCVVIHFKATLNAWRSWVARSSYRGRWRDVVNRSALALKLLTSVEHGSMVAALTFGLPEQIGGVRNWDYRYTWLRDSTFMIYAFLRLGHTGEAGAFMRWLAERQGDACDDAGDAGGENGPLQLMYGLDGHQELDEQDLPHLRGYRGSVPVRIGNGAWNQLQLDIYGELMDAIYLSDKYGEQVSYRGWQGITRSMEWLACNWQQPDEGIWETRGGRQHFLHSRLMCWVAFDRAIRLSGKRGLPAPIKDWLKTRDTIYREIHEEFWDPEQQAFVQSKGSTALDASCLLMPLVRFISPTDPRWLSTLRAIGEHLVDDSLVYRYAADGADGLHGDEGTFTMCSFWYVECLARAGDLAQARFLFEKMLGYANHLGLFAEELGAAGEHLGNFPQAFTHMALISAAHYLDRALTAREGSAAG
nr:glycoside hydrolase family 15 protein [uncultured Lichenicoccus sp.]